MKNIKIAILGDPHFYVRQENDLDIASHNQLDDTQTNIIENSPWYDLKVFVEENQCKADLLICVGDLTTRSNLNALKYGWGEICEFARKLNASCVVSTVGNHDIFSRSQATFVNQNPVVNLDQVVGMYEPLKLLTPAFPIVEINEAGQFIEHPELRTEYFGNSSSYHETEYYRIITLNSCSEHGHDESNQKGTIPLSVRINMEYYLSKVDKKSKKFNLLVCHHPPQTHVGDNLGNHDFIEFGDKLIEILESFDDDWIVFHGHKHHADIRYAKGSSSPPIIFAASSLGSVVEASKPGMLNQFYILNMRRAEYNDSNVVIGEVKAWNWYSARKWEEASPKTEGIHNDCGFGLRIKPNELAQKIYYLFEQSTKNCLDWRDVVLKLPELKHVIPYDLRLVRERLEHNYKLIIQPDKYGFWDSVEEKFTP